MGRMLITTTSSIENQPVREYLGLVTGETIMGANILRDFMASITDIIGGRASAYEKSLVEAKEIALNEMIAQAEQMGANAIIGVDLDYETISAGGGGGMLMVSVSGTAVITS
jgi:uncharacterized protein YbjQ (UPF0145 family)